ncbi:glycine--tRNA ligase [candidate division WWE3 bacterium CG_4_9_14_0_2_um_filter_35_11]|uniref:glycine--tRNA ligase n=1 Tax=candidate division WWE3 bacterium CG_4_9_14_0_2_um_filter_35_11 TaxID=1975077 RepID=A0A2M8EMI9_UNCKA|nr:MAG: glycine--tRNA ligase [candidate division WWE3 bacterium CG10_big_fil_rev_8_21_14_0_10_35_32]PJC23897.1 MAG: glycine--tRNA ligase [candidate division WWE3 bacterium CG_4_9_14_0_2_um_filter_35_11]
MDNTQKIISLCKRRGFVFPSSEIYGGFSSTYDYGPLGAQMLKNIKNSWWKAFVESKTDVVGLDGAIFCHPKTWEASGHVASFNDPLVEDKKTHIRYRADHLIEEVLKIDTSKMSFEEMQKLLDDNNIKSPSGNELTKLKSFNLLVSAELGSTDETKQKAYLRGETCQVIFLQYLNVMQSMRLRPPFGIAQIGKAFRNEITTKDFIYRMREFTQMELEYFVDPKKGEKWYEYWKEFMLNWFVTELGMPKDKFRYREIPKEEMSHYAKIQNDFEFESSSGKWFELSPLNHRGDYDLSRHQEFSGVNFKYKDQESGKEFMPNVIEISIGIDRTLYALLDNAYFEDGDRVVLKLDPKVAPYDVAVFPLVKNKPEVVAKAKEVYGDLVEAGFVVAWDDRANVGKRYYSQDEIGTPKCITIDYQTLEDGTVTIRDRDTTKQIRVKIEEIKNEL